jgi:hypothetical protein
LKIDENVGVVCVLEGAIGGSMIAYVIGVEVFDAIGGGKSST